MRVKENYHTFIILFNDSCIWKNETGFGRDKKYDVREFLVFLLHLLSYSTSDGGFD